jgi:hypothetical protein
MIDAVLDHPFRCIAGLVVAICLFVAFGGCGKQHFEHAVIANKVYAPSSYAVVSTGKTTGTAYVPERYSLVLRFDDGSALSTETDATFFVNVREGMDVQADVRWWGIANVKTEQ